MVELGILATGVCFVLLIIGFLVRNEPDNDKDDWLL